jgi:hypothetical protein
VTISRLLLGATALAVACAPATRSSGPGPVTPVPERAIALQVSTARLALDSATRRGDRAAMTRWLAEDAIIISGIDTLQGPEAVARLLSVPWPGTSEPLHFAAGNPEYCMDGAYENGSAYTIVIHGPTEKTDTVRFRYAALWRQVDSSRVAMRAVALAPAPHAPPKLKGCIWATPVRFDATRVRISLLTPAAFAQWNAPSSLQDAFRTRGYTPQKQVGPTPWAIVGLRWRAWSGVSIEALLPLQSEHDSVVALNVTTGSQVTTSFRRSGVVGALLGYEWRRLRLGAGPIFLKDTWSIREAEYQDLGSINGPTLVALSKLDTWTESRTGLLLEVAYTVPTTPWAFLEVRAQQWSVASRPIHGAGQYPPVPVNSSGYLFAVALGVAF